MTGFAYFVPGRPGVNPSVLKELGLAHAFEGDAMTVRQVQRGPGDLSGVLVAAPSKDELGYFPNRQEWTKTPGGKYWIGRAGVAMPGPKELERPALTGSYAVVLGDNRKWRIPTAILAAGWSPLPKVRRLNDRGEIERKVEPAYEDLYLKADRIREAILAGDAARLTDKEEWDTCVAALRTNYRISGPEISILGLLTDDAVNRICWTLVDRLNWTDVLGMVEGSKRG